MLRIPPQDDELAALQGVTLIADTSTATSYRLDRRVGAGGMSVAYFALRRDPAGECPAVVKVLRPWFVRESGASAALAYRKEAIALGRLNERVPSSPFVVRMLDLGDLHVTHGDRDLTLPWLAVEYVHGGAEGTTLAERVASAVGVTGQAFDIARAARAIECLAEGLTAVHEVAVTHRDVKPENVLCCGFGNDEIFKITDFGIARPAGLAATFGGLLVGTPGYAAPEQAAFDEARVGPWTDVFGFAALVFFLLTGEDYFPCSGPEDAIRIVRDPRRRSLAEAPHLNAEIRDRPSIWRALDAILAQATAARPVERPQSAAALAALVAPWLRTDSRRLQPQALRISSAVDHSATNWVGRTWNIRHRPSDRFIVRNVAWTGDGTCLAATNAGLAFFNGLRWLGVSVSGAPNDAHVRFVRVASPGRWMVGGDGGWIGTLGKSGLEAVTQGHDSGVTVEDASGDLDDLAVLVQSASGRAPWLQAIASHRWVRALPLDDVSVVTGLARFDDTRWLVAGRTTQGDGFAAVYEPLMWTATRLGGVRAQSFLTAAAHRDRGLGLLGGTQGTVLWVQDEGYAAEVVDPHHAVAATAIDVGGRGWAAAAGKIWLRKGPASWVTVWEDSTWTAPFVSLHADVGVVFGVTADGGILEGRTQLAR